MAKSAIGMQDSKLFSYLDFPVCFACYPPKSFKIICLTCIWLKFVDTSFHSSQKKSQKPLTEHGHFFQSLKDRCVTTEHGHLAKPLTEHGHFFQSLKDRCVKLKLPGGWKLGPYLAKPIDFLWAKFGSNRK